LDSGCSKTAERRGKKTEQEKCFFGENPYGSRLIASGVQQRFPAAAARPIPQIFERLFSKKKRTRKSPRGWNKVECREFEGVNLLK